MNVRYLGHSCFLVSSSKGSSVVIDPYSQRIPYELPQVEPDIVLVSHEHHDHNAYYRFENNPMLVKRLRRLRASRQKARAARRLGFDVT